MKEYAHTCCDGHDEIGFNDPEDKYGERCPVCSEIDRLVDGVRDKLIALGAPADRIDGAGCDSGDPLDFMQAEITQAFNYFEDQRPAPRLNQKSMSNEQTHNAGNCEICAAVIEAGALGAVSPVGHKHETIQKLAEQIAEAIRIGDQRKHRVTSLLLAFAEEIKRQAVEP